LAIGPSGSDIAKVLNQTGSGVIVDFDDVEGMKKMLFDLFAKYQNGTLTSSASGYEQYSRRAQCGVMAGLLDDITK
jgi:hypothetical protein